MTEIPISDIVIGKRHRKDMGDVQKLADSIASVGLLHPIVLTKGKSLVVGERRVAAFRLLNRDKIPATIVDTLSDLDKHLTAEADENVCRKSFEATEAVAIGLEIEKAVKPIKEAAQREAGERGKEGGRGKKKTLVGNSRKGSDRAPCTTDMAAAAVGMDRRTYEKAKEVVASKDNDALGSSKRATAGCCLVAASRTGRQRGAIVIRRAHNELWYNDLQLGLSPR